MNRRSDINTAVSQKIVLHNPGNPQVDMMITAADFISSLGLDANGADWNLNGNTVTVEKWLGTVDAFNLPIRTNNIERMEIGTTNISFRNIGSAFDVILNNTLLAANRTYEFPNKSGTFAMTSDISGWSFDGNTVTSEKWIGTIDNFAFPIRTNNTEKARFLTSGEFVIGGTTALGKLHVKGTADAIQAVIQAHSTQSVASSLLRFITSANVEMASYNQDNEVNMFFGKQSGVVNNFAGGAIYNTAFGFNTLTGNTTGFFNTAFGYRALASVTSGNSNVGIGVGAVLSTTTGNSNIGIGYHALMTNTDGYQNIAIGHTSLSMGTSGHDNTAVGHASLSINNTGAYNTAYGSVSMTGNTGGNYNTSIGDASMYYNTDGSANVAVGMQALYTNNTGNNNTAIGRSAGLTNNTSGGVYIGFNAGSYETAANKLFIDNADRTNEATGRVQALIYGVFDAATANQLVRVNGSVETRGNFTDLQKTIDTTAGDSVTINAISGRFRKDTSGSTFTLTNSYITANSIIHLQIVTAGLTTGNEVIPVAGSGSVVVTFQTSLLGAAAPSANCDVNFWIVN